MPGGKPMKKYLLIGVGIIAIATIFFLWLNKKGSPIIIGFMGPLTGKYADLGVSGRNGAFLAVEDINARGGINGRALVIKAADDQGTPEGAKEAFMKLKEAGVAAIVGPMLSTSAYAIKPLIDQYHIVAVSPTASTSRLSAQRDYFFRVITNTGVRAKGLARFALEILSPPKTAPRLWCFVYDLDNMDYTTDFMENFSTIVEEAGDLTACRIGYSSRGGPVPEFIFRQIEAVKPDAVVLAVSAIDGVEILHWLENHLSHVPGFACAWMMTAELRSRFITAEPLDVFAEHIEPPTYSEKANAFRDRFWKRYGKKASFPAFFGYFAVQVLAKALEKTEGKPQRLHEVLSLGVIYDSFLVERIVIDEFGDAHHSWWIYKLENNRLKVVNEETSYNGWKH
jgi:branched-chain amino acid transport system substrate-binding protein